MESQSINIKRWFHTNTKDDRQVMAENTKERALLEIATENTLTKVSMMRMMKMGQMKTKKVVVGRKHVSTR